MAGWQKPAPEPGGVKAESDSSAKGEAAFRGHLTVYLVTGLFLLSLNLLTSPGELWFYWPLFFWSWALDFQAVATYGADAPARALAVLRSIVPGLATTASVPASGARRRSSGAPFAATAFAAVHDRIQELKAISVQIPDEAVREWAVRIGEAADRIVAAMAADRTDARTVTWFERSLLEPTASLLGRFVRLRGRGVSDADETLRRVEEQTLPLLESRFDTLYAQLHRGEIVDLEVATEMLDFELLEPLPAPSRKL